MYLTPVIHRLKWMINLPSFSYTECSPIHTQLRFWESCWLQGYGKE